MPLQIRRGTEAERLVMASPPAEGEMIWVTDDRKLYIGDGATLAVNLPPITGYNDDNAQQAVADAFNNGDTGSLTFAYNAGNNAFNVTMDLTTYLGEIRGDLRGSVVTDDSTLIVNGTNGSINLDGTVKGNIIPATSEAYDLGSASNRFRDIWLSGSSIRLGNATITANGSAVNLPEGSTVNGAPIGGGGAPGSNINVNIIGDDSSIIVDSATSTFYGSLVGDVQGSVYADDSTVIIDGTTGDIFNGTMLLAGGKLTMPDTNLLEIGNETGSRNNVRIRAYPGDPGVEVISELLGAQGLPQLGGIIKIGTVGTDFATPTPLTSGDLLGQLQFGGYTNQGSFGEAQADLVAIRGVVDDAGDTISNAAMGKFQVYIVDRDDVPNSKFMEFEGAQGILTAPVIKPGSYANDTARDAAITSPQAGMMIFNLRDDSTGVPVFQGYDGTNWVDLH